MKTYYSFRLRPAIGPLDACSPLEHLLNMFDAKECPLDAFRIATTTQLRTITILDNGHLTFSLPIYCYHTILSFVQWLPEQCQSKPPVVEILNETLKNLESVTSDTKRTCLLLFACQMAVCHFPELKSAFNKKFEECIEAAIVRG